MNYILLLVFTSFLFAAPAFQNNVILRDSHSDPFYAQLKGDEYLNWFESDTGEILLFNKQNKRYEYARIVNGALVPSGIEKRAHTNKRSRPNLTAKEVRKLWKERREKALQRRKMPR